MKKINKLKSQNAFIPVNVTVKPQLQSQPNTVPLGVLEIPNGTRLVIKASVGTVFKAPLIRCP